MFEVPQREPRMRLHIFGNGHPRAVGGTVLDDYDYLAHPVRQFYCLYLLEDQVDRKRFIEGRYDNRQGLSHGNAVLAGKD